MSSRTIAISPTRQVSMIKTSAAGQNPASGANEDGPFVFAILREPIYGLSGSCERVALESLAVVLRQLAQGAEYMAKHLNDAPQATAP